MVITQTPLRISLTGGGTDLPAFYRIETGAVISLTINKHIYITISDNFNDIFRISYTQTELAPSIDQIQHDIVREALKSCSINKPLEITTIGDVPAGTGLGSSSSLAVGLLSALDSYRNATSTAQSIAERACRLEMDTLHKSIGKQDQFAAAIGGINLFEFHPNEQVTSQPIVNREWQTEFEKHALLVYTASARDANDILVEQTAATASKVGTLKHMRDQSYALFDQIKAGMSMQKLGAVLNSAWSFKKSITASISNSKIDNMYSKAMQVGAWGGKLLGAGGGGFLLLIAPPDKHGLILSKLGNPKSLSVEVSQRGTTTIFNNQSLTPGCGPSH